MLCITYQEQAISVKCSFAIENVNKLYEKVNCIKNCIKKQNYELFYFMITIIIYFVIIDISSAKR